MHRLHYRRYGQPARAGQVVVVAMAVALAGAAAHGPARRPAAGPHRPHAAAVVIAYAREQVGKPYLWAGTGPGAFDCSGLAMQAYRAAGIFLPRTSQQQWARGPRVSHPRPGDLVFFAGKDGTRTSPGHVGIVTGPHMMIDAYATGYGVEQDTFGRAADAAKGLADPVGYTDPLTHSGATR